MTQTHDQADIRQTLAPFIDYCHSFYGAGGVYDMGATYTELWRAAEKHFRSPDKLMPFEGDSIDREQVREILIAWGLRPVKEVAHD